MEMSACNLKKNKNRMLFYRVKEKNLKKMHFVTFEKLKYHLQKRSVSQSQLVVYCRSRWGAENISSQLV